MSYRPPDGQYTASDRTRRNIAMGLLRANGWTTRAIAARYGVSQTRVSQVTRRARPPDTFPCGHAYATHAVRNGARCRPVCGACLNARRQARRRRGEGRTMRCRVCGVNVVGSRFCPVHRPLYDALLRDYAAYWTAWQHAQYVAEVRRTFAA